LILEQVKPQIIVEGQLSIVPLILRSMRQLAVDLAGIVLTLGYPDSVA
jgi:hypothetical protein